MLAPSLAWARSASQRVGTLAPSTEMHLTLGLELRNKARLDRLLGSGRTLTPSQYAAEVGPSPAAVSGAEVWLRKAGLATKWTPGDSILEVNGPAGAVERAFGVRIGLYRGRVPGRADRQVFYAPLRQPVLPAQAHVVTSVLGLDDFPVLADPTMSSGHCSGANSPSGAGGFTPSEVAGFYDFGPLYKAGLDGSGQTVVFMETDGYQLSDLQAFAAGFKLPPFQVDGPVVNQAWGTPATIPFGQGCWSETELDLEIVHAMAPGAKMVVYEAGIPQQGPVLSYVATSLQAAISQYPHAVFNLSLGWCEDAASSQQFEGLFTQLEALGGTAFVSSGDNGAYARGCPGHNLTVSTPADAPHAVAVGGTTALVGVGSTYGEEAAWGEPYEQWGTGGGLSKVFPRPAWQVGPGVDNQYSNGMRQIPDVAAIADSIAGWDQVQAGVWTVMGGTSAAAPLWCALGALTDEALSQRNLPPMGFANPALYDFGASPGHFPAPAYHSVTRGTNLYYPATSPGWNFGTGWGSPVAAAVVDDFIAYEKGTR